MLVLGGLLRDSFLMDFRLCYTLYLWPQTLRACLSSPLLLLLAELLIWVTPAREWSTGSREKHGISPALSWTEILALTTSPMILNPTKQASYGQVSRYLVTLTHELTLPASC